MTSEQQLIQHLSQQLNESNAMLMLLREMRLTIAQRDADIAQLRAQIAELQSQPEPESEPIPKPATKKKR